MNHTLLKTFLTHYLSDKLSCHTCGDSSSQLYKCGAKCDPGVYCSKECQTEMWRGVHKHLCFVGNDDNKRKRGDESVKNDNVQKRTKTKDLALFEELLTRYKDITILVLRTMVESDNIAIADIYAFYGTSKIIREAMDKSHMFWYLTWKHKFSDGFENDGSPKYDKNVNYKETIFESNTSYTISVETQTGSAPFRYTGQHEFRLRIMDRVIEDMFDDLEYYLYDLEQLVRSQMDGSFQVKYDKQNSPVSSWTDVDDSYIWVKLAPRRDENYKEMKFIVTFVAPKITIIFRNEMNLQDFVVQTINYGIYSKKKHIAWAAKTFEVNKLRIRAATNKIKFTQNRPWAVMPVANDNDWPVIMSGTGSKSLNKDRVARVLAEIFYKKLDKLVDEFIETDIVYDALIDGFDYSIFDLQIIIYTF